MKSAQLDEQFKIEEWPRYYYDLGAGTLTFSKDDKPKVIAEIEIVGSTSEKSGNWLWAWANKSVPSEFIAATEKVRDFGELHGFGELTTSLVEGPDLVSLGWALTAVTARVVYALGAYRPPRDTSGNLFYFIGPYGGPGSRRLFSTLCGRFAFAHLRTFAPHATSLSEV